MYDWDGLKCFLAVAREGSTLAASRALGVNQTTVARRIEALEATLNLKLFERGQSGSRISEAGLALLAEAEAMEAAAARLQQKAAAQQRGLGGTIRVTCSEIMANMVLTPVLADFRRQYPDIRVELALTDAMLDIQAGEADIALRGAATLSDSDLVARKVNEVEFGLYCSQAYAEAHGLPTRETLDRHVLIAGDGEVANLPGMAMMLRLAPNAEIGCRSNSLGNLIVAIKSGVGVAPMACLLADGEPDLVPVCPATGESTAGTWIVTRRDLKNVPKVRAFIDFIVPHIQSLERAHRARADQMRAAKAPMIAALTAAARHLQAS